MHGGDRIAAVLQAHGVQFLFTLCGGHISPILAGAKQRGIRVIDVRQEATAVFAADAVARLSGVPGVAAVTAGPGLTNTITAVKNAQLAQSPVVVLGGATATALKNRGSLQDIDQMALMRPHVKYARGVQRLRDLIPVLDEAFDAAQDGVPGPVFVECPVDLLYEEATIRQWYAESTPRGSSVAERAIRLYLKNHVRRLFAGAEDTHAPAGTGMLPPVPDASRVKKAAGLLADSERPLMVIGSQALADVSHTREIARAVEKLNLPVYLSGMARGLLGKAHPLQRRHKRRKALKQADLVILAGVPCDFRLDYGRHIRRAATLISANRSRRDLRLNRRPDLAVPGDAGHFLTMLAGCAEVGATPREAWHAELRARDDERESEIERQARTESTGLNPLRLCRDIDDAVDRHGILVADGGDFVATASYIVKPRAPLSWLDPGVFGTLGVGAGFALGAKLVRPDDEVWVLFGDGAFGYSAIELDTFVRHKVPVIAVIGNDACWTQIVREQVKMLGDDVGCRLTSNDYDRMAAALGCKGLRLDDKTRTGAILAEAKNAAAAGQPAVVNALLGTTDFREGSISM